MQKIPQSFHYRNLFKFKKRTKKFADDQYLIFKYVAKLSSSADERYYNIKPKDSRFRQCINECTSKQLCLVLFLFLLWFS